MSGTAKATPNFGGPVDGAGQVLGWTRALRPPGVSSFPVRGRNVAVGDALMDQDSVSCYGLLNVILFCYELRKDIDPRSNGCVINR